MSTLDATIAALRAALAGTGAADDLGKAATFVQPSSATTGLQDYDLSPAVLNLYPVLTPLRNKIPRVGGGKSIQANWKAVTAIDTGNVFVGVSEGHRGSVIGLQTKEYFAAYRTLGTEASLTDESVLAAADFDDVRARAANTGLQVLMLGEEKVILGGNTNNPLGVTPQPVLVAQATGGNIPASTAVSVIVVALTLDGLDRAQRSNGVQAQVTRVTADSFSEVIGGGSAQKSPAQQVSTGAGGNANSVVCTVPPVQGALSYAFYAGAPGAERLFAITNVSQVVLKSMPTTGQLASDLPSVDSSTNSLVHDGLLSMAGNAANGAYWKAVAPGTSLTAVGNGAIQEFDDVLQMYWDKLKLAPSEILISSQEQQTIRNKILAGTSGSGSRFTFNIQQNSIVGGGMPKGYLNPYSGAGASEIPMSIHPNMPAGTVLFLTHELPYQLNNVDNVLQIRTRKDYYQTEWPRRTRAYEYGVYTDQVLQNKFMPGMAVITNLSPGT